MNSSPAKKILKVTLGLTLVLGAIVWALILWAPESNGPFLYKVY